MIKIVDMIAATAPIRQRPYYSTPCPAGDVQSVIIVESPCTPHWTPNYWRPGPVIRPPARWTMLVEELPKSMLRQSPNQQIPFCPTPGLNAPFKGLLLTDAKRHMCHVPCAMCTMCHVHIVQTNDAGTNAICFTETVAVQDWKQLASNENSLMLRKEFRNKIICKNSCDTQLDRWLFLKTLQCSERIWVQSYTGNNTYDL